MEFLRKLYAVPFRLRGLFRRNAVDHELDEELRYHLEELTRQNVARGMAPDDARRAALLALEGVEQQKELCRDARGISRLEHLWQDLRFGGRMLRKNPGFTLVAVLALALGIGANTAIFSIVYGVLFRPLPYPDADRVALVYMKFSVRGNPRGTMSVADFFAWRARNTTFEEPVLISVVGTRFDISTGTGEPEQVRGSSVTSGFFSALRVQPLLGRVFGPGEDSPGHEKLAVISETLWRKRFAADPKAVGQPLVLNGVPHTIIGVLPGSFRFAQLPTAQVWTNFLLVPPTRRGPFFYYGMGRLKPGVSLQQAQAEMAALAAEVERESAGKIKEVGFPVVPLREAVVANVRGALLVLFGAVFFVLLISTVNVANLSLSRAQVREREIALRSALGADRGRIVRQLLTESVLLSLLGGVTGLAVAYSALRVLRAINPGNLPRMADIRLDFGVLAFTVAVSVLTGIVFGLFPALQTSHQNLDASLKQGGKGTVGGATRHRTHSALIVVETALSLVLLIGAGLLIRSFNRLQQIDAGFSTDPAGVVYAPINLSGPRFSDNAAVQAFFDRLTERMNSIPGMQPFVISDSLPPERGGDNDTFVIQGRQWTPADNPSISLATVGPGYFRTLGIPLVSGREFTDSDRLNSNPVAIVSESWAKRYFPNESALGHRIKASGPELSGTPFMEIVGVAGDVKYEGLQNNFKLAYYQAQGQSLATSVFIVVKPGISVDAAMAAIRRAVHEVDPAIVVQQPGTLEDLLSESVAQPRFRTVLLATFAGLALLLAAIGIYGVIAYSVAQRSNEIGVRMALGARRGDVLRMVVGQGFRLTAVGLAIGAVAALALTRVLRDLLYAVRPTDPLTFFSMTVLLLLVALAACMQPAWRATRVDPIIALRHD